jgi:hypothetical protein
VPTKAVKRITSWSYSRWAQYEECPLKAKLKFLDKLEPKEKPDRKALDRGTDIHALADEFIRGKLTPLPKELQLFKGEFTAARKLKGVATELEVAYDNEWNKCDWKDWDRAWVRIKIDLMMPPLRGAKPFVKIVDHKTGRLKETQYDPQLELYAISGLLEYPQAQSAITELWFLDAGEIRPKKPKEGTYARKDLPKLIKLWEQRVQPMLTDTKFAPKPGMYCPWCEYSKAKGGPCKF